MEDLKNKDLILLIKCMSNNRLILLNIIILSRKNHLEKFFSYNNLVGNVIIAVNNIKYNNNELSLY